MKQYEEPKLEIITVKSVQTNDWPILSDDDPGYGELLDW